MPPKTAKINDFLEICYKIFLILVSIGGLFWFSTSWYYKDKESKEKVDSIQDTTIVLNKQYASVLVKLQTLSEDVGQLNINFSDIEEI